MVLVESNVSDLTEILSGCTSKWKELATSLGLPDNEIKNILSKMHMYTPVMCLKEILLVWVMCKYEQSKPPTLDQLERALSSKIVGLGLQAFEHVENLTTEGTYKGIIKCHEEPLTSKTIVLTINSPIDRFINVLTDFYNHQPEVREDTWPPTSGNTYISLSLVKHEGIHHAGRRGYSNSADQTVYEMVFNSLDLGARLLIDLLFW